MAAPLAVRAPGHLERRPAYGLSNLVPSTGRDYRLETPPFEMFEGEGEMTGGRLILGGAPTVSTASATPHRTFWSPSRWMVG